MDVVTGSDLGPLNGLSRVKGNFHARFLGEGMAARSFPYPTYPSGRLIECDMSFREGQWAA